MSKKKENDYVKACALCENATNLRGEANVLCKYKGVVSEDYVCRKFAYDPLKREPKAPLKIQPLSKDDVL